MFQPLVTYEQPPTYFATNKVTSCFQEVGAHTPLWCLAVDQSPLSLAALPATPFGRI